MNYWTNSRVHNGLSNWTYNGDTTMFGYETATNGKQPSRRTKDSLNQLWCSLGCATHQLLSNLWWMLSVTLCLFFAFLPLTYVERTFIFDRTCDIHATHFLLYILFMLTFYMSHDMTHWLFRSDSLVLWLILAHTVAYDSLIRTTHTMTRIFVMTHIIV